MSKWLEIAKRLNEATGEIGENQKKDQSWCALFVDQLLEATKKQVAWCKSLGKPSEPSTGDIAIMGPNRPNYLSLQVSRRTRLMEKYKLKESHIPALGHLFYSNAGIINLDHLTGAEVDRIIEAYNSISENEMRCLLGETNEPS